MTEENGVMVPDKDGETVVSLNENEMAIIEFINESLLNAELDAKKKLIEIVKEKYGEEGTRILALLEGEDDLDMGVEDCPECGEISEEWLEETKQKMEQFDVFLDDSLDEVASEAIESCDGIKIGSKAIVEAIYKKMDGFKDGDDVPSELINKVKMKILYIGMIDGWLIDEYFED